MSFKKKLVIAFSIVIILPVILFLVAFFVVGNILFHQTGDGTIQSYSAFWTDQQTATQEMDSLYNEISDRLASDPTSLEDTAYLDSLRTPERATTSAIWTASSSSWTSRSRTAPRDRCSSWRRS